MYICMYARKRSVWAWPRRNNANVTKLCKEKEKKSLALVAIGIGYRMQRFLLAFAFILCPLDKASHTYPCIIEENKQAAGNR